MRTAVAFTVLSLFASPALAGEAWDEIRSELYGERAIQDAGDLMTLEAPYRASDDREVPISASVRLADGRTVKSLSIIIDDNPMPVSAVFDMAAPESEFATTINMRINGPTPVRAVLEASDGALYMTDGFVKTSGLGACAAPPVNNVDAALAELGQMELMPVPTHRAEEETASPLKRLAALSDTPASSSRPEPRRVRLEMKHPSHSGMQMDQITLLYILARYVETVEVWTDEDKLFTMTGSISLSEDPEVEFTYGTPTASSLRVKMTDTDGTVAEEVFPLGES